MRFPNRWTAPILAAALLAALAPSAFAQSSGAKKSPKKAKAAPAQSLPPIFDPELVGTKAMDAAVVACNETSRRVFVVLGTNDCKPCRVLNDVVHDPALFEKFIQQFVPVLIDVSPGGPNVDFVKNYGIDAKKGFPAVAIFESPEVPPIITRKGEMVALTRKGPDAVRGWIESQFGEKSGVTVAK